MNHPEHAATPGAIGSWPSDPPPLTAKPASPWRWVGTAISAAVLVAVLFGLRDLQWRDVRAVVPTSIAFWIVFAAYYIAPVCFDWVIFRRLWGIPASGFMALLRKLVGNELLLGYIGELYFYSWARKKLAMTTSPFGAVKDSAILSALVGNAVTLAMMIAAFPLIAQLQLELLATRLNVSGTTLLVSVGALITMSTLILVFGKRLFSLTRNELWTVTGIHFARIVTTTTLAALAWNLALPQVALSWWVVLSTVRLLISRLPFVPQKDIAFAAIAVFMVGYDREIAALMTFMAAIILLTHLVFGAVLAISDFVTVSRDRAKGEL